MPDSFYDFKEKRDYEWEKRQESDRRRKAQQEEQFAKMADLKERLAQIQAEGRIDLETLKLHLKPEELDLLFEDHLRRRNSEQLFFRTDLQIQREDEAVSAPATTSLRTAANVATDRRAPSKAPRRHEVRCGRESESGRTR